MSPRLSSLLEGLLQPAYEDRLTATQAKAVLAGQGSARQQQRQQQKAWNPFSQDGWEEARQGSKTSSSDRQVSYCNQDHVKMLCFSTSTSAQACLFKIVKLMIFFSELSSMCKSVCHSGCHLHIPCHHDKDVIKALIIVGLLFF